MESHKSVTAQPPWLAVADDGDALRRKLESVDWCHDDAHAKRVEMGALRVVEGIVLTIRAERQFRCKRALKSCFAHGAGAAADQRDILIGDFIAVADRTIAQAAGSQRFRMQRVIHAGWAAIGDACGDENAFRLDRLVWGFAPQILPACGSGHQRGRG